MFGLRVKDSSMPGTPSRIFGARMTFACGSISALRNTLQISGRGQGMERCELLSRLPVYRVRETSARASRLRWHSNTRTCALVLSA